MRLIPELEAMVTTMTAQMAKQRKRSRRPVTDYENEPVCLYRGMEGCMCAVGALIPDELYDPKIEVSVHRLFSWTYDEDAIKDALACEGTADRVEPAAKVARHLASLAPSLSHRHLLLFLSLCQRFHDSQVTDAERYSYESVMVAAPDDISDEDLQERLIKRLTGFLVSSYNHQEEFWVKP